MLCLIFFLVNNCRWLCAHHAGFSTKYRLRWHKPAHSGKTKSCFLDCLGNSIHDVNVISEPPPNAAPFTVPAHPRFPVLIGATALFKPSCHIKNFLASFVCTDYQYLHQQRKLTSLMLKITPAISAFSFSMVFPNHNFPNASLITLALFLVYPLLWLQCCLILFLYLNMFLLI